MPLMSMTTTASLPTTQASWPGGRSETSPGPNSISDLRWSGFNHEDVECTNARIAAEAMVTWSMGRDRVAVALGDMFVDSRGLGNGRIGRGAVQYPVESAAR